MNDGTSLQAFSLTPTSLSEAMELAKIMASSDLVPKDYKDKPGNVLIAVQMGAEVGLKPMQAIQGIAIINGRPTIWGDALWSLIKGSPLCEWTDEKFDDATMTATCIVKRRGTEQTMRTFSKADAEKAGLWTKGGPWGQYPKRMLQMRARAFACRDAIPEALKGFPIAEERVGIPREIDMGDAVQVERNIQMPRAQEPQQTSSMPEGGDDEPLLRGSETTSSFSSGSQIDRETGEVTQQVQPPGLIQPGALKVLNSNLADRELRESFCKAFSVADPSELAMSKVNDAMSWIAANKPK